jgi:hypothetical protein
MKPIPTEIIERAIQILGREGISEDQIESEVAALVAEPIEARRLIDWIPEAFALVLVAHHGKPVLPKSFSARNAQGRWQTFPFACEPLFVAATQIAESACREGLSQDFQNVALRSSTARSAMNALDAGASIDGAVFSGPALIGIPAEVYPDQPKPWWRRLFSRGA